ncbi:sulfatase-like hydrolase/transferase [Haloarchaeobius sp. TZWSO28]|uniref:sulfatase-like hydrolase/transferase n=1 Tax=Haloarchaeobius sp. TZWSO28 TaxID=3446119 RepID=UPI003EBFD609
MAQRNIVLVVLDSVRKDFFDEYAPRIRRRSDIAFEQCRAVSSWSTPSHASMISGELPSVHGVHTHSPSFSSLPVERTFFNELDEATTIGVSANEFASSSYEFDRYFDRFVETSATHWYPDGADPLEALDEIDSEGASKHLQLLRSILGHPNTSKSLVNLLVAAAHSLSESRPIPKPVDDDLTPVLRAAKREVRDVDSPYFLFLNIMEAHMPLQHVLGFDSDLHDAPWSWSSSSKGVWELMDGEHEDYWETREGVYAAAIDYIDRKLASFAEWLDARDDGETTIIVTADHGENHGRESEGGLVNHKSSLSEGLLHVPLEIINPPKDSESVTDFVSHAKLPRLITGIANESVPDVTEDVITAELVGLSAGPEPPEDYDYWDRAMRCAYRNSEKVVWDSLGETQWFELEPETSSTETRVESTNGIPDWATERFATEIGDFKREAVSNASKPDVSGSTEQRLKNLGYL